MQTHVLIAIMFALLLPSSSWGADLMTVFNNALKSDPVLLAEAASRNAVGELDDQALANFLPDMRISANTGTVASESSARLFGGDRDFNSHGYVLSVTQPLYRREHYVQDKQADLAIARAQADYAVVEQAFIVRVAERYFAVLAGQDDVDFAEAEQAANAKQLEEVQQRFDVGLATITDLTASQAGYDLSVADVISAENALANSQARLHETAGRYYEHLASLQHETPLISPDPQALDEWVQLALMQNPALQASTRAREEAQQSVSLRKSGHYPTLDLVGERSYSSQSDTSFGGGSSKAKQDSISIQFNLPLYEGGAVASQVREASHRLDEAMQNEEAQRRVVMRESREFYNNVVSGISRVNALKQAVISAEKALESTEAGYDVGTRTTTDVLSVRRDLFRAKRDYASARYDYILSTLRLKQATGILAATDLANINQWLEQ